jgi:hypothetical protein
MYWGAGRANEGWPTRSQWVSFENMFNNNKNVMFSSCSQFGVPNDSGPEVGAIWNAIQQVAAETGVDHRFILAVIMQGMGFSSLCKSEQSSLTYQNRVRRLCQGLDNQLRRPQSRYVIQNW